MSPSAPRVFPCRPNTRLEDLVTGMFGYTSTFSVRFDNAGRLYLSDDTVLSPKPPKIKLCWAYVARTIDGKLVVNFFDIHFEKVRKATITNLFTPIDLLLIEDVLYGHFNQGEYNCTMADIKVFSSLHLKSKVTFWVSNKLQYSPLDGTVIVNPNESVAACRNWKTGLKPSQKTHYEVRAKDNQLEIKLPLEARKPHKRTWVKVVFVN